MPILGALNLHEIIFMKIENFLSPLPYTESRSAIQNGEIFYLKRLKSIKLNGAVIDPLIFSNDEFYDGAWTRSW